MNLDLRSVPFSRFGSYMTFNVMPASWNLPGLLLRTLRYAPGASRELMRLELTTGGLVVPHAIAATPTCLRLEGGGGVVEIVFAEPDALRIRGTGVGLRLASLNNNDWAVTPLEPGCWQWNPASFRTQYRVTMICGRGAVSRHDVKPRSPAPQVHPSLAFDALPGENGRFEVVIEELVSTARRLGLQDSFEAVHQRVAAEWAAWLARKPWVSPRYRKAAELAMYVNWSAAVAPSGMNQRTTLLMSKLDLEQLHVLKSANY